MRKRKLLTESTLEKLYAETNLGVPLARAMGNNQVTMSRPAVDKLLKAYAVARQNNNPAGGTVRASLFPVWLVIDGQEQPDEYSYSGFFPFGEWTV